MAKHTQEDIENLADEIRHARDSRPFALLTGAGCSKKANIPLAGELVKKMNEDESFAIHLRKLSDSQRQDYGQCMHRLPKNMRKELLGPYLDKAKINWAHIAIAAMMKAGYIDRVLTFNFDNVLARACGLCGEYPAIYDYVTGVSASTDHIVSPCIIHLHGQGTGLAMLNSDEETKHHANRIEPLIRETMGKFPLLVIGYSGESDAVFPKINQLYDGQEKLHWCDYGKEPKAHVRDLLAKNKVLTQHYGGADADLFLVQLAQELKCFPPAVFSKPLDHLRAETVDVQDFPTSENANFNVLAGLHTTLDKYESALKEINGEEQQAEDESLELLLSGSSKEIISRYENGDNMIPPSILSSAYHQEALKLHQNADINNTPDLYNQAFDKYRQAIEINPDRHEAFNNWGLALQTLGAQSQERDLFEQAFDKYRQAIEIKPDSHEAFYNWGLALSKLGEQTQERELYEQAFDKYRQAIEIKPDSHETFYTWGLALSKLGEQTQDRDLFEQAFDKYRQAIEIKPDKYKAFKNWGGALLRLWRITQDQNLLITAEGKVNEALILHPEDAYNAACVAAILGNSNLCRHHLEICREAGTLPEIEHLLTDPDLNSIHHTDWFKEFINKL